MSKVTSNILRLCRISVMVALYVLLNMVAVKAGNLRITFASLPVVVSALLFGPIEAVLAAFFGEFGSQLLSYGLAPTTVLWLIPPAVRGLVVGAAAGASWRTGRPLESRPWAGYAACILAALATTGANTLAIWADSLIYGYYSPAVVFGAIAVRLVTGIITAVIIATVALPLAGLLRRQGLARA